MTSALFSLSIILLIAAVTPVIAELIPGKPIPETVFLLVFGAILGPYALGLIQLNDSVNMLSELGLGFLFLMAGYEIDPKTLTGHQGRVGALTWVVTLAIALVLMFFLPLHFASDDWAGLISSALVLTTTALGTLMPILQERELIGTRVGDSVLAYGTWGELLPIIAMAVLLSSRATWLTAVILLAFGLVCVLLVTLISRAKRADSKLVHLLEERAETTSQTIVRAVALLLVALLALSSIFDLDVVLGAFAAGFILRAIFPDGDENLETKLDGIGYGFFIPIFFVVSGAKVDLTALVTMPLLLVGFICMLLLVRATPIYLALKIDKQTRDISPHNRLAIALYCTTALPLIVAITSVATSVGAMTNDVASVLVGAGALTVFLMPLLANIAYRVVDAQPIEAAKEIAENPHDFRDILRDHMALERALVHSQLTREQRQELIDKAVERAAEAYQRRMERLATEGAKASGHGPDASSGDTGSSAAEGTARPAGKFPTPHPPKRPSHGQAPLASADAGEASAHRASTGRPVTPKANANRSSMANYLAEERREWLTQHIEQEIARREAEGGNIEASDLYQMASRRATEIAKRAQRNADFATQVARRVNRMADQAGSRTQGAEGVGAPDKAGAGRQDSDASSDADPSSGR